MAHQRAVRIDRSNYASVNLGIPSHPDRMGVNTRQDRHQNRINQGVHSGQLTAGETSHVEYNETAIHNEVRNDREANGGHLTAAEHNHVEHQQNKESRQIYHDKHNVKTDAWPGGAAARRRAQQRVEKRDSRGPARRYGAPATLRKQTPHQRGIRHASHRQAICPGPHVRPMLPRAFVHFRKRTPHHRF